LIFLIVVDFKAEIIRDVLNPTRCWTTLQQKLEGKSLAAISYHLLISSTGLKPVAIHIFARCVAISGGGKTRNRLKLSAGDILRLIQCKTVFSENKIGRLLGMILLKQPFRLSSLENLFNLRIW